MTHPYSAKDSKGKDEQWLLEEKYCWEKTAKYDADRERLAQGEPLGYVIGWQPFLGLKIYLDSKPLIPRPETEWWVEQMLAELTDCERAEPFSAALRAARPSPTAENGSARSRALQFLDLCAGSGAIGCSALARLPTAHVYFGEIDPAHEATIQRNIRENDLDVSRTDIRIGDLFEPFNDMRFDVIAVNPPYVPINRILPASVADYEPDRALYAGADGLDIIRRVAAELPNYLAPGGTAWIECDTAHAAAACAVFETHGLSCKIRTDQYDKPRILVVHPMR